MTLQELLRKTAICPADAVVYIQDGEGIVWTMDEVEYYPNGDSALCLKSKTIVLKVGKVI